MKKILVFVLFLCYVFCANAQDNDAQEKADSLFLIGYKLCKKGMFKEAVSYFQQYEKAEKRIWLGDGKHSDFYKKRRHKYSSMWIDYCLYKKNNYKSNNNHPSDYLNEPGNPLYTHRIDSLYALIEYEKKVSKVFNRWDLYEQLIREEQNLLGETHSWIGKVYKDYMNTLAEQGNWNAAISKGEKAVRIYNNSIGNNHYIYWETVSDYIKALFYAKRGNDAKKHISETNTWLKERFNISSNDYDYWNLLNRLLSVYNDVKEYEQATMFIDIINSWKMHQNDSNGDVYIRKYSPVKIRLDYHLAKALVGLKRYQEAVIPSKDLISLDALTYHSTTKQINEEYLPLLNDISEHTKGDVFGFKKEKKDIDEKKKKTEEERKSAYIILAKCQELIKKKKYEQAINYARKARYTFQFGFESKKEKEDALCMKVLAQAYYGLGNYPEAIRYIRFAKYELLDDQELEDLANKCITSYKTSKQVKEITKYPEMVDSLLKIKKYEEAYEISKNLLNLIIQTYGTMSVDYANALSIHATISSILNNNDEGIESCLSAIAITDSLRGETSRESYDLIYQLGGIYFRKGDYQSAYEFGLKHWKWIHSMSGIIGNDHTESARKLIKYCRYSGNAKCYLENSGELLNDLRHKDWGDDLADSYLNIAIIYEQLSNFSEALDYAKRSYRLYSRKEKDYTHYHNKTMLACSILGRIYCATKQYSKADSLCSYAVKGYDFNEPKNVNWSDVYEIMYYLLQTKMHLGQYDFVTYFSNRAINFVSKNHGNLDVRIADFLDIQALAYFERKDLEKAILAERRALDIVRAATNDKFGRNSYLYTSHLISMEMANGNFVEMKKLIKECVAYTNKKIMAEFGWMVNESREKLWDGIKDVYTINIPQTAYYNSNDKSIVSLAFDASLLSKGILLNADMEIDRMFKNHWAYKNDLSLIKSYRQSSQKNFYNTSSVKRAESNLTKAAERKGGYVKNLFVTWQQIRNSLSNNDIAIDFIVCPLANDSIMYAAITLKKDYTSPHFIVLFEEKTLSSIPVAELLQNAEGGSPIWGPLKNELHKTNNIYFSPAGILQNIPIEYLALDDGNLISEKYNIYRLSSIRELTKERHINNTQGLALFGGLNYNMAEEQEVTINGTNRDMPIIDDLRSINNLSYLQGSEDEVKSICDIISGTGEQVFLYTAEKGTEAAFKLLPKKNLKYLHIATHGFYEKNIERGNLSFLLNRSLTTFEDKALSRSGLLLSGAMSSITSHNEGLWGSKEDGILTAREVSFLNFSGLDMVVLSACQTGLGDITSEGVFGLQRGFKKAGVETILMSLWNVNDQATSLFMVEMYKRLAQNESKLSAFKQAQKVVMDKYPDPKCWAAFVLLDAINH